MLQFAAISTIPLLLLMALTGAHHQLEQPPLFTSDLIAWSSIEELHEPEGAQSRGQRTPEPVPETQPPANPTPSTSPRENSGSHRTAPSTQVFTGTIVKQGLGFRLRISPTTSYKLDSRPKAQPFEGQRVRVIGTLDAEQNLIHVEKIEPLS